jgi:hypothetical protein
MTGVAPNAVSKVPAPGVAFSEALKRMGVSVKHGVNLKGTSEAMLPGIRRAAGIISDIGVPLVITSAQRPGRGSFHNVGNAVDMRLKSMDGKKLQQLRDALGPRGRPIKIKGEDGTLWRHGDFEYILHGEGDNVHLHIERDTFETKAQLRRWSAGR